MSILFFIVLVFECCGYSLEELAVITTFAIIMIFLPPPQVMSYSELCGVGMMGWGKNRSYITTSAGLFSVSLFEKNCTTKKRDEIIFDGCFVSMGSRQKLKRHTGRSFGIKLYMSNLHTIAFVDYTGVCRPGNHPERRNFSHPPLT